MFWVECIYGIQQFWHSFSGTLIVPTVVCSLSCLGEKNMPCLGLDGKDDCVLYVYLVSNSFVSVRQFSFLTWLDVESVV